MNTVQTKQAAQSTLQIKRYSLTVDPMSHRDGWDIFGELVSVRTISTGMRVEGGELVVLEIYGTEADHAHVVEAFHDDPAIIRVDQGITQPRIS